MNVISRILYKITLAPEATYGIFYRDTLCDVSVKVFLQAAYFFKYFNAFVCLM